MNCTIIFSLVVCIKWPTIQCSQFEDLKIDNNVILSVEANFQHENLPPALEKIRSRINWSSLPVQVSRSIHSDVSSSTIQKSRFTTQHLFKPRFTFQLRHQPKKCPIYRRLIENGEEIAICPGCDQIFHLGHYAEWIRQKGKCPLCHKEIIMS